MANVLFVKGFCDDFQSLVRGIRTIRKVMDKVKEFEAASGLQIHRTKSKIIPSRTMTASEKRSLNSMWSDANVVNRSISLGMPIGHGVSSSEVSDQGAANARARIDTFSRSSMSWTMRILAVNMFIFSLTSYSCRLFLMLPQRINDISNRALRFLTPVPFLRIQYLKSLFQALPTRLCAERPPL